MSVALEVAIQVESIQNIYQLCYLSWLKLWGTTTFIGGKDCIVDWSLQGCPNLEADLF